MSANAITLDGAIGHVGPGYHARQAPAVDELHVRAQRPRRDRRGRLTPGAAGDRLATVLALLDARPMSTTEINTAATWGDDVISDDAMRDWLHAQRRRGILATKRIRHRVLWVRA